MPGPISVDTDANELQTFEDDDHRPIDYSQGCNEHPWEQGLDQDTAHPDLISHHGGNRG